MTHLISFLIETSLHENRHFCYGDVKQGSECLVLPRRGRSCEAGSRTECVPLIIANELIIYSGCSGWKLFFQSLKTFKAPFRAASSPKVKKKLCKVTVEGNPYKPVWNITTFLHMHTLKCAYICGFKMKILLDCFHCNMSLFLICADVNLHHNKIATQTYFFHALILFGCHKRKKKIWPSMWFCPVSSRGQQRWLPQTAANQEVATWRIRVCKGSC